MLRIFHDRLGHFDGESTYLLIRKRCWWPKQYESVINYVRGCLNCQRRKPLSAGKGLEGMKAPVSGLFDTISIDFAGPLPLTPRGNRFLLIAVEHLTGWPMAVPLPTNLSTDVASFVEENIVKPYQAPRMMLSDNGSQFTSQYLSFYAKSRDIDWRTSAGYNPQGNGRAERMVRTIKDSISKLVEDKVTAWDEYIDVVLRGYRVRETRDHPSPFYMLFGVEPRILPSDQRELVLDAPEVRALEIAEVSLVRDRRMRGQGILPVQRYWVGDLVLLARTWNKERKDKKLALRWEGPYEVKDVTPPTYMLRTRLGRRTRTPIHERRLRLYSPGQVRLENEDREVGRAG